MQNYYNLDFATIYDDKKEANVPGKIDLIKKTLELLPNNVDFNNVDEVVDKLRESGKYANSTLGKHVKNLAAFIQRLGPEDLAKMGIVDKLFLVRTGFAGKPEEGSYYKKRRILDQEYKDRKESGTLSEDQETRFSSVEEYEAFYQANLEAASEYLDNAVLTREQANDFTEKFLVCFKHDLPDMRGGPTYSCMQINHQSQNYNHVIYSKSAEMIMIVYNRYKTVKTFGVGIEFVSKVDDGIFYRLFVKMIEVARLYGVEHLFYDYVKDHEYTDASFNTLVAKAHTDINITQRDLRIIDESIDLDKLNPIDNFGYIVNGRIRRGHNMMQGYLYAKRMRKE